MAVSATTSVSLALICNLSLGVSLSLFAGARVYLNFAGRVSVTAGANVTFNLGSQNAFTTGLATAAFTGGRFTTITGLDAKKSTADIAIRDLFFANLDSLSLTKTQLGNFMASETDASLLGFRAQVVKALDMFL